jgi:hypothetical protein
LSDFVDVTVASTAALHEAQRRRRGVQAELVRLERAIASPSTGREQAWVAGVTARLRDLRVAFGHHVEVTEGAGGLFEEVVTEAPRLHRQVEHLRADHAKLNAAINQALALGTGPAAAGHVSDLAESGLDLLSRLTRHRHLGATMVYEAYTVDMDAAD